MNEQPDLFKAHDHRDYYKEGYNTGLHWDANWIPGGPFNYSSNPESVARHSEWMAGWRQGFDERLTNAPEYAKWWNVNSSSRSRFTHSRYVEPEKVDAV